MVYFDFMIMKTNEIAKCEIHMMSSESSIQIFVNGKYVLGTWWVIFSDVTCFGVKLGNTQSPRINSN